MELIVYSTLISCLTYAMWNVYSCRLWQTLSHFISCKHTRDIYLSAYFHLSSVNHRGNSLCPYLHFLYSFSIKWVHFFKLPLFIPSILARMRCLLISPGSAFSRYLATASSDHTVRIWNVDGFTLEKTLTGIHEISTFCYTYCVSYMSQIDPIDAIEPTWWYDFATHVLTRTSKMGLGLCVLRRWCLSYNRYLY